MQSSQEWQESKHRRRNINPRLLDGVALCIVQEIKHSSLLNDLKSIIYQYCMSCDTAYSDWQTCIQLHDYECAWMIQQMFQKSIFSPLTNFSMTVSMLNLFKASEISDLNRQKRNDYFCKKICPSLDTIFLLEGEFSENSQSQSLLFSIANCRYKSRKILFDYMEANEMKFYHKRTIRNVIKHLLKEGKGSLHWFIVRFSSKEMIEELNTEIVKDREWLARHPFQYRLQLL